MALDAINILSDAFWAVVLPELPAGSVRVDGTERWEKSLKALYRSPGDDPVLTFEHITLSGKPTVRTFGMNRDDDTTDYAIAQRYVFRIGIKSTKAGTDAVSVTWSKIDKALAAVYPHMGLSGELLVSDFQFDNSSSQKKRDNHLLVPMTIFCRPNKSLVVA